MRAASRATVRSVSRALETRPTLVHHNDVNSVSNVPYTDFHPMSQTSSLSCEVAILGAGPIGLEAALHAARRGYDVRVFEADEVGAHVADWSHVEMFSPWNLNRSDWGEAALREAGFDLADPETHPTGGAFLEQYLQPLAQTSELRGRIETQTEVLEVSRLEARKDQHIGDDARSDGPFVLALDRDGTRDFETASYVVDATGTYRTPNGLGPGGLEAIGEPELSSRIDYYVPDVLGDERADYADSRTLVVGSGYSAITTLHQLLELRDDAPETDIHWLLSRDEPPYVERDDDPLPQRKRLAEKGNALVDEHRDDVEIHTGTIERIRSDADGGPIEIERLETDDSIIVDRLVANVGYRPDVALVRDLQVHLCYATEGPMDLAATLIGGSGDCLDQSAGGVETLTHPEPDFFILGSKSYGRNSTFLLKVGHEQIERVFEAIET